MAITETLTLPSGRVVTLQMPDLYGILASVGRVPSQHMIEVLNLLVKDGAWAPEDAGEDKYLTKRNTIRGYYAIAALCMASPRMVLDGVPGEGEIGPADVTWADVEAVYWGWFRGWRHQTIAGDAGPADVGGLADAAPDRDGVRADASAATPD